MPKVRRFALSVLKPYAVVSAVLLPLVVASNFAGSKTTRLEVLDVERINIVEKDGTLRLAISNKDLSPGLIERGKDLTPSRGRTGLIFYNDEGTECGGLIFSGQTTDGKTTAVGSLTFDQYETDQAVALQYVDDQGSRRAGLAIMDYREGQPTSRQLEQWAAVNKMPAGPEKDKARQALREASGKLRLYVGRSRDDGAALLSMNDAAGRERLRLTVDPAGAARIEFLDANGVVVSSLAPNGFVPIAK